MDKVVQYTVILAVESLLLKKVVHSPIAIVEQQEEASKQL
jgi:hypothetical protein